MKGFYQAGKEVFHGTKRLEKRMSIKNLNCVFESTKYGVIYFGRD